MQEPIRSPDICISYEALSDIYQYKGDYDKALFYLLKTIKSVEATGEQQNLPYVYLQLGGMYRQVNENDKSVAALQKAYAIAQRTGQPPRTQVLIAHGLSFGLCEQGKKQEALAIVQAVVRKNLPLDPEAKKILLEAQVDCYLAMKQYKRAEKCLLESYALNDKVPANHTLPTSRLLGQLYIATKQYGKAKPYLDELLAAKRGLVPAKTLANVHAYAFLVDSAQGNYLGAIAHFRRYKTLDDSIFDATKSRQVEELQVQYQTEQKEQNIALLTKQTQVQQARIQKREFQRNAFLAGAVLLALLLCVSYNRYRLKQRSNQLLEVKQQELEAQQQEINRKNQALEHVVGEKNELLVEKEWMLKEIHHRVKNNLQVISSLLNSQSSYLHDSSALDALREGQNRVQAMALIHQKLYQSDNMARVDMQGYLREIVDNLLESFDRCGTVQGRVEASAVELEVALATPLGLLINEAVTNSLKHAFPNNRCGTITVGLAKLESRGYLLTIVDDGVGLPSDFDPTKSRSLGLTIIQGMSRQIHGTLSFGGTGGVTLHLQFEGIRKDAQTAAVAA
nr:tetratricopeptide repeat protein [Hymenobacter negativus]